MAAEPYFCRKCGAPRRSLICPRCQVETIVPDPRWNHPPLPDVEPIRNVARELGWAIGEHGSRERDLDLIAVPWTEEAVEWTDLVDAIGIAINAKVSGKIVDKPHNRKALTLQIDGWFRPIDLSIFPGDG